MITYDKEIRNPTDNERLFVQNIETLCAKVKQLELES